MLQVDDEGFVVNEIVMVADINIEMMLMHTICVAAVVEA
jgi:hypothetical protein